MEQRDYYGVPFRPRIVGYALTISGVHCTASEVGPPDARRWKIRDATGRLLGTGRSVSAAVRRAQAVLEGEER